MEEDRFFPSRFPSPILIPFSSFPLRRSPRLRLVRPSLGAPFRVSDDSPHAGSAVVTFENARYARGATGRGKVRGRPVSLSIENLFGGTRMDNELGERG